MDHGVPGVPYVAWAGGEYFVRVDLDPDDAREVFCLLGSDGAAPAWWEAAERCAELRVEPDADS